MSDDLIMVLIAALAVGTIVMLAVDRSRGVDEDDEDAGSQPRMTKDGRVTVWDIATGTFLGGCLLLVACVILFALATLLGFARVVAWFRDAGFFAP